MSQKLVSTCAQHGEFVDAACAKCSRSVAGINQADPVLCAQHDCVTHGKAHAMHHVDNLAIVYGENLSEVELKLAQVEKLLHGMQADTAIYARNLEVLENEESSAIKRIDAVVAYSKQQLWCLTGNRKTTLRDKLQIPVQKDKLLAELREAIQQLSVEEFLQQRSAIDLKCSNLMAGCSSKNVAVEPVDDLQCDLIPPYWSTKFTFPGFLGAVNKSYSYAMYSTCDVIWDIIVTKSSKVEVKLTPRDPETGKFRHKVVVLIPHSDFAKTIRHTYEVEGISNTWELVEASHLTGNDKGELVVSVAIHPIDAVVENRLLNYQYQKLKTKNAETEQQLTTITNGFDYKYHIMNFKMYIWKMEMEPEWYSLYIVDDENRQWGLYLSATINNYQIMELDAYVQLMRGTATNCRFFIQMIHENSAKSILKTMTSFFYQDDFNGFDRFITWKALMNDDGFYPDDNLRFRFGVRPLPA